jgi:hypothetical protein
VVLQLEVEDTHIWKFLASGLYSIESAYEALFIGATCFKPWEKIWRSWPQGRASCSYGQQLTIDVGQLTG